MSIKFSDLEDAFFYVSSAPMYTNEAILCREKMGYDFENARQTEALKEWCEENEIKLNG